MEVGNGMSAAQDRAHFSMWCIMASPLVAGNDVRTMSDTTRDILTNPFAIAVNQDPLGKQAVLVPSTAVTHPGGKYPTAFVATCNGQAEQQWQLSSDMFLRRRSPQQCLDLHDCDRGNGSLVGVWECTTRHNQCARANDHWTFTPLNHSAQAGVGTIRNQLWGACLGVEDMSGGDGQAQVKAFECQPDNQAQHWKFPQQEFSSSKNLVQAFSPIVHVQSKGCLSAPATPPPPPPVNSTQVWAKPLSHPVGALAIVLLNRGDAVAVITAEFSRVLAAIGAPQSANGYAVFDIWANNSLVGNRSLSLNATVQATSAAFYKLIPQS